jgi:hypothetical protein
MVEMFIAQSLGRTHAELLATVSPSELDQWHQLYALHPWGPAVDWHRFAVASYLLSRLLDWETPPTFEDFLPKGDP